MSGYYKVDDGSLYYEPLNQLISEKFDNERQMQYELDAECRLNLHYQSLIEPQAQVRTAAKDAAAEVQAFSC